eukprot:TRINITY_DN1820_c0_g1_i1.p1 TRINITY_DN1820_c0_g1~~TRINITY_DN1820_c0_g1_i1.p1  ORF type:complete len:1013 (+),score=308.13 TRINITY_DN1820_c0_g1_i1:93-3131(+)
MRGTTAPSYPIHHAAAEVLDAAEGGAQDGAVMCVLGADLPPPRPPRASAERRRSLGSRPHSRRSSAHSSGSVKSPRELPAVSVTGQSVLRQSTPAAEAPAAAQSQPAPPPQVHSLPTPPPPLPPGLRSATPSGSAETRGGRPPRTAPAGARRQRWGAEARQNLPPTGKPPSSAPPTQYCGARAAVAPVPPPPLHPAAPPAAARSPSPQNQSSSAPHTLAMVPASMASIASTATALLVGGPPGARGVPPSPVPSAGEDRQADWGAFCTRPLLLQRLESYLDDELTLLEDETGQLPRRPYDLANRPAMGLWRRQGRPSPARARIFLDVLRHFAASSRIYGELLGAVCRELYALVADHVRLCDEAALVERGEDRILKECKQRIEELEKQHGEDLQVRDQREAELRAKLKKLAAETEEQRRYIRDMQRVEKACTEKYAEERERVLTMVNVMRDADEQHQEVLEQLKGLKDSHKNAQEWSVMCQTLTAELAELKDRYKETKPMRDYNELTAKLQLRLQEIADLKHKSSTERKRAEHSEKKRKELLEERERLAAEMAALRERVRAMTPRPGWRSLLGDAELEISLEDDEGGRKPTTALLREVLDRLARERAACNKLEKEVDRAKKSLGFLKEVQAEEEGRNDDGDGEPEFFTGLGMGRDVPRYLRWFGQVANRRMPKRDLELWISEFWAARAREWERFAKQRGLAPGTQPGTGLSAPHPGAGAGARTSAGFARRDTDQKVDLTGDPGVSVLSSLASPRADGLSGRPKRGHWPSVEEFMYDYLKQKYGVQAKLVEKGYNIKHACRKYQYDGDCELFLLILEGQLPEAVYFEQAAMLQRLQKSIEDLEAPVSGKKKRVVKKAKVIGLLDRFFPAKSEKFLLRLKYALSKQFPGDDVNVTALFAEDRDGSQGPFVESVRNQMVREALEYVQELSGALMGAAGDAHEDAEDREVTVTLPSVKDAILGVDPNKPEKCLEAMINMGLGTAVGTPIDWGLSVELTSFIAQLKQGYLVRHTRPVDA